jgi:hypothetical protein
MFTEYFEIDYHLQQDMFPYYALERKELEIERTNEFTYLNTKYSEELVYDVNII